MGFTHSVAIATLGRPGQVRQCIESLAAQTVPIHQLILADDTPGTEIEEMVPDIQAMMPDTEVLFIRMEGRPSLTRARNAAKAEATGDLLSFFDSDTIVYPDYLKIIQDTFQRHPDAPGVMGLVLDYPGKIPWKALLLRTLLISHTREEQCRLLHPLRVSYPRTLSQQIETNWLFGCNMNVPRRVYTTTDFCDQMERYSYGEDIDYSYRILKAHGGAFIMTPEAKIDHVRGDDGRVTAVDLFRMRLVNKYFIAFQHEPTGLWSRLKMKYQDIGNLVWYGYLSPLKSFRYAASMLRIWWLVLWHAKDLRRGDLRRFNRIYSFMD